MSLRRTLDTVRTLRPLQLGARAVHELRLRAWAAAPALPAALWPLPADAPAALAPTLDTATDAWAPGALRDDVPGLAACLARARATLAGTFEHQRIAAPFSPPVDWVAAARPKLWRYHLHYHAELVDLAVAARSTGEAAFAERLRALVDDWSARCPPGRGDAWEAYPLSRRLLAWAHAATLVRGLDLALDARLARSFARQARYLAAHVEHHLLGNHLLANRAALTVAARALGEDAAPALGRLRSAVQDQLLADGFHVERTPGYQALVLDDLLAVHTALDAPPPWLDAALGACARALVDILHPDGELPLLNDTALGQSPPARELLDPRSLRRRLFGGPALARHLRPPRPRAWLPEAGLLCARDGADTLVFDAGPLGAPHLSGHGHSDTLGFELSHAGRRVLVDSGVGSYAAGPERDYFRSARAHNVVTVDLEGPDALWAAFRVGRRGVAGPLEREEREGRLRLRAALSAPAGWRHTRTLWWAARAGVAVLDELEGLTGGAITRTHIHVHPSLDSRPVDGGFVLSNGARLTALSPGRWEAERGARSPVWRGHFAAALGATEAAWELALVAPAPGADGRVRLAWSLAFDDAWNPRIRQAISVI